MRRALATERHAVQHRQVHAPDPGTDSTGPTTGAVRRHADGHVVALRPLPDYDALFGVDFTPDPTPNSAVTSTDTSEEASN